MKLLLNAQELAQALQEMTGALLQEDFDWDNVAFIGIRTRGDIIARRLSKLLAKKIKKDLPVGALDINLYRDDLTQVADQPIVQASDIPFPIDNKEIILVDDVLYTGRTIRAALDALIDFGRSKRIRLIVLVDRGLRELPIQPDYAAKRLHTKPGDNVKVMLQEIDGKDQIGLK